MSNITLQSFSRRLLKIYPSILYRSGYFCLAVKNGIADCFSLDKSFDAHYIWKFSLPTYDNPEFIHMSFGERLPTPDRLFRLSDFRNEDEAVSDLMSRILRHRLIGCYDLASFSSEQFNYLRAPRFRFTYVVSALLSGGIVYRAEAKEIVSLLKNGADDWLKENCDQLISALEYEPEALERQTCVWQESAFERLFRSSSNRK